MPRDLDRTNEERGYNEPLRHETTTNQPSADCPKEPGLPTIEVPADDDSGELDPRQEQIVLLLSAGRTHIQTAEELGISTKSVQREVAKPAVRTALDREARNRVTELRSRLLQSAHHAVATLADEQQGERPADRIRAATLTLELSLRYVAQSSGTDLAERLNTAEKEIDDLKRETLSQEDER